VEITGLQKTLKLVSLRPETHAGLALQSAWQTVKQMARTGQADTGSALQIHSVVMFNIHLKIIAWFYAALYESLPVCKRAALML
jgi:hypothetical protein